MLSQGLLKLDQLGLSSKSKQRPYSLVQGSSQRKMCPAGGKSYLKGCAKTSNSNCTSTKNHTHFCPALHADITQLLQKSTVWPVVLEIPRSERAFTAKMRSECIQMWTQHVAFIHYCHSRKPPRLHNHYLRPT